MGNVVNIEVGNTVLFKKELEVKKIYGKKLFLHNMKPYKNTFQKVARVYDDGVFEIERDPYHYNKFKFTPEMVNYVVG